MVLPVHEIAGRNKLRDFYKNLTETAPSSAYIMQHKHNLVNFRRYSTKQTISEKIGLWTEIPR